MSVLRVQNSLRQSLDTMVVCGTLGFPTLSPRFSSSLPWQGSTIFSALWMKRVPEADRGLEQESSTTCRASLAMQQTGSSVLARLGFLVKGGAVLE